MFSNSSFRLDYFTMSNQEIMNLKIETLSDEGFCFLWVVNSLVDVGYKCLQKWGYTVVDHLVWAKTHNGRSYTGVGYYFNHSTEFCLVGHKRGSSERSRLEYV